MDVNTYRQNGPKQAVKVPKNKAFGRLFSALPHNLPAKMALGRHASFDNQDNAPCSAGHKRPRNDGKPPCCIPYCTPCAQSR